MEKTNLILKLQAERFYEALVRQQQQKRSDPDTPFIDRSDLVFDPTRPSETDWETILKQVPFERESFRLPA